MHFNYFNHFNGSGSLTLVDNQLLMSSQIVHCGLKFDPFEH